MYHYYKVKVNVHSNRGESVAKIRLCLTPREAQSPNFDRLINQKTKDYLENEIGRTQLIAFEIESTTKDWGHIRNDSNPNKTIFLT